MCYSKAEGGARCSAHAREALDKALVAYSEARSEGASPESLDALRNNIAAKRFAYHTTPEGRQEVEAEVAAANDRYRADTGDKAAQSEFFEKEYYLRKVTSAREEQEAARARHHEVLKGDVGEYTKQAIETEPSLPATREAIMDYKGEWSEQMQIGVLAIDEPYHETNRSYATASWYTGHDVKPGIYPVYLTRDGDVSWSVDTTVTAAHFPSSFGGVPIGGSDDKDAGMIGKEEPQHHQAYSFQMPGAYVPGVKFGNGSLVLRDGVDVGRNVRYQSASKYDQGAANRLYTNVEVKVPSPAIGDTFPDERGAARYRSEWRRDPPPYEFPESYPSRY